MNETPCCGNCCYWLETPSAAQGKGDNAPIRNGVCRRFPPQMLMLGIGVSPIARPGMAAQPQPLIQPMFPTMTEFGWCGEHPLSQAARSVISMTLPELHNPRDVPAASSGGLPAVGGEWNEFASAKTNIR